MKPKVIPLYFDPGKDDEFDIEINILYETFKNEIEFLPPQPLGKSLPECDAVIFPQLLGEAYRQVDAFREINRPILIITSEYGTQSMWDWEICDYLRREGIDTVAPDTPNQAKRICRALGVKRKLSESKMLVFQDNPGKGFQASIFKRFYWWEDECIQRMNAKFGIHVEKRSYRELAERALKITDAKVKDELNKKPIKQANVSREALYNAVKLYLAINEEINHNQEFCAIGINCLNESHFSNTTPCLAWSWLYDERRLIWGCEADLISMLTEIILDGSLQVPLMMSNLYPFIIGQTALKHEKIPSFPDRKDFENYLLAAHCGYLGVLPQSNSVEWTLKPKVLEIVDNNAIAIDARLAEGPITLVKITPTMDSINVVEGLLEGYVQYPNSHCLNGGVIRVDNGPKLIRNMVSHHSILVHGKQQNDMCLLAKVFGLKVETI